MLLAGIAALNVVVDPFGRNRWLDLGLPREQVASVVDYQIHKILAYRHDPRPVIVLGDSRVIPLNYDLLLQYVLDPNQQILSNHIGSLSASSRATVNFFVPNAPVAIGATVYAAFIVANPSSFAGIGTISPALPITLQ